MESNYYFIQDNLTEIISICFEFKHAYIISTSTKYTSNSIYFAPHVEIKINSSLNIFHKFINIKILSYYHDFNCDITHKLSTLTTLEDLAIKYTQCHTYTFIDIKKIERLTSFRSEHYLKIFRTTNDTPEEILLMEKNDLQKLTLNCDGSEKIKAIINCPQLTYLNLSTSRSNFRQPFDVVYNEIVSNLRHLTLKYVDFNMTQSFKNLTYLYMKDFFRSLCLNNLENLRSLHLVNIHGNLFIGNLSKLTNMNVSHCIYNIEIYNLNNLKTVSLNDCEINHDDKIKLLENENIKYLNIDDFEYHGNAKVFRWKQEKMLIDDKIFDVHKLRSLKHLTHLILINYQYRRDIFCLEALRKLTMDTILNNIKTNAEVLVIHMTNEEAKLKYGEYLLSDI